MSENPQTLQSLFGDILRNASDLAQKEFALFRAEMNDNIRLMFTGMAMIVAAAIFAIAALILFTKALVDWLATIVHSDALAALIVGGVMALVAIALALLGRRSIAAFSVTPKRTLKAIKQDADVLSERAAG